MDNNFIINLIARLDSSKVPHDLKKIEQQLNSKGIHLKTVLDTADTAQEVQNLTRQFNTAAAQADAAGKAGKGFTDTLGAGFQKLNEWGISNNIFMGIVQGFKDMISNVHNLSDAQLELSKVSDLTANGLKEVTQQAYARGETLGKTGTQTLHAITAAQRAGYSLDESMVLAEDALKLTNVAEGINDAGTAMEGLINILKGSGKDSSYASGILDMINEISNTQQIDFDTLIDGGQQLSAAAAQSGVSLEEMFGVLTGGYETLGNMEAVSDGAATIFSRLQSVQIPGKEDVLPVSKLQETINTATNGVVDVVDQSTGQLRDAYSILDDINSIWGTLDETAQDDIAFAAGGTEQSSVFQRMMQNWDGVEKSAASAANSLGSADIENEKYLDSLSGRISQFQAAFEELSANVLNSDLIGFFVDLGTSGVKAMDGLVNALTPLGTLGAIGGGILGAKNVGSPKMFGL